MANSNHEVGVAITKDGPYLVTGRIPLAKQIIGTDTDGGSETWQQGHTYTVTDTYALCRCGQSKRKPLCDGTHAKVGFDGTETASRAAYLEQAQVIEGPTLLLADAESLCAFGRFCDPNGKVWNQVTRTDDPQVRETFLRQVENCPAGRLVAIDRKTGKPLFEEQITGFDRSRRRSTGAMQRAARLRGGIAVTSADGFDYEVRNRVTLCRCGQSSNKPFCDGTHASIKFSDE